MNKTELFLVVLLVCSNTAVMLSAMKDTPSVGGPLGRAVVYVNGERYDGDSVPSTTSNEWQFVTIVRELERTSE